MPNPFRADVPADNDSVFAKDGRVFVSIDALIDAITPGVERRTKVAHMVNDHDGIIHTDAENMFLNYLRDQREILSLENNFSD